MNLEKLDKLQIHEYKKFVNDRYFQILERKEYFVNIENNTDDIQLKFRVARLALQNTLSWLALEQRIIDMDIPINV